MKVGEIWTHKETERQVQIDDIDFSIISTFTLGENETLQSIKDKIKDNQKQDDIIYAHWIDTGEDIAPPQPRTQFIKEFRRDT